VRGVYPIAAVLLAVVAGCTAPGHPQRVDAASEPRAVAEADSAPARLLERAADLEPDAAASLRIEAARALLAEGRPNDARGALEPLDLAALPRTTRSLALVAHAEIALEEDDAERAAALLQGVPDARRASVLEASELAWVARVRARTFEALERPIAALRERLRLAELDDVLASEQRSGNRAAIWRNLLALPPTELDRLAAETSQPALRGWAELARIGRGVHPSVEAQRSAVDRWRARWPDHPAARELPAGLARLPALAARQPQRLALLLPLSGPLAGAGQAVRDGFMAAHLDATVLDGGRLQIDVYDTARVGARDAYLQAVDAGAELVIGPLAKNAVAELASMSRRSVTVLALNVLEANDASARERSARAGPNADALRSRDGAGRSGDAPPVLQFGLLPEDEGRQVAERAWADGHRRALVLGAESEWAQRVYEAFRRRWQALGGELVQHATFAAVQEIDDTVAQALLIDASEQRARALRRTLARRFEYRPRRRHDIDFAFLIANPVAASTLKPALGYYYAEDLPAYASSHVFEGNPASGERGTRAEGDLDGIRFCDMPWRLLESPIHAEVTAAWPKAGGSDAGFYALGVDAFRLHERLPALMAENGRYYGVTGTLTLDASNRIVRELTWATIRDGRAVAIPTALQHGG